MVSGDKGWGSDNPSVILYLWGMLRENSCGNNPTCKDNLKAWNECGVCFFLRHCMKVIGDLQSVLLGLWATDVWWMCMQLCYGGMYWWCRNAHLLCNLNHLFPWWCLQY